MEDSNAEQRTTNVSDSFSKTHSLRLTGAKVRTTSLHATTSSPLSQCHSRKRPLQREAAELRRCLHSNSTGISWHRPAQSGNRYHQSRPPASQDGSSKLSFWTLSIICQPRWREWSICARIAYSMPNSHHEGMNKIEEKSSKSSLGFRLLLALGVFFVTRTLFKLL